MKTILLCILFMTAQLLAQSWNNIVTTTINEPNCERMDLFTNKDGNHIIVQSSNSTNSIKYYLLNSSGTVVRSSTIETASGAHFPNISGDNDKVYLVYKLGSNLKANFSTNAGQSWNSVTPQGIGNNTCNGVDIAYDQRGLHVVYGVQSAFPNFKTYYYRLNSSNNWIDYKEVTDYGSEVGGHPRIALSANKVHVVYNTGGDEYEENSYGPIISRDKDLANDIWETPILAFEATQYEFARDQHILIDDNNVEWLFLLYFNLSPGGPSYQEWIAMVRQINGFWQDLGELPPYSPDSVQQLTFCLSKDMSNKICVFYSIQSLNSLDLCRTIINNGNLAGYSVSSVIHPLPLH